MLNEILEMVITAGITAGVAWTLVTVSTTNELSLVYVEIVKKLVGVPTNPTLLKPLTI